MALATPVVLIIYNRPHLTERVFAAISAAAPAKLLVVADGPRFPQESAQCNAARLILNRVDWDCELQCDIAEKNMGCRERIVSGLQWVFTKVDEAIILEDDCVPHPSFFRYCENLLAYYRNNEQVMEIGGCNYQSGRPRTEHSYYFSKYSHTNGWATWRRAWQHFDESIAFWPEFNRGVEWTLLCKEPRERQYWNSIYDKIYTGVLTTTWDYQWQLARWYRNGLATAPNVNLISNIGFGPGATHTRWRWNPYARLPTLDIGAIRHPSSITRNEPADHYMFENLHLGTPLRRVLRRVRNGWRLGFPRR